MSNTIVTSILPPLSIMDIARSTQHDSRPATNTTNETDQKEDPMTANSIKHNRQSVEHAETAENKRAKDTYRNYRKTGTTPVDGARRLGR